MPGAEEKMSERRNSKRAKSFLPGLVYVSRKPGAKEGVKESAKQGAKDGTKEGTKDGALSCTIRDMSDTGARIAFSDKVSLPDTVELHIPERNLTLRAKVRWRRGDEVGLAFAVPVQHAADGTFSKTEVVQRVAMLEAEIESLRSVLKQLKRDKPGRAGEAAA
jgi:uncharacterized small protein (DUF1192 family)